MKVVGRYIRECGTCYSWAVSNDPREEKVFRNCPLCVKPMYLLSNPKSDYYPIGKGIDLPESYPAPKS